jgi:hypothetical protein
MRISKKILVHAIFTCSDCGKTWESYLTARVAAQNHAKKHGHTVQGDLGYSITYSGKRK